MANYIKGISGDCADCAVDDPCDTDGPTEGPIDDDADASDWFIEKEIRLHDLDHTSDPQIFVVFLYKISTPTQRKAIAVRSSGIGIIAGPSFAMGGMTPEFIPVRTSHTGNTFAAIRILSTSSVDFFSVNPTTLVITRTAYQVAFTSGYQANAACFARDDEIGMVEVTELPGPGFGMQYYYWTIDITGGGTGITENTRITETKAGDTAPTFSFKSELAKIERIDDDEMIAHLAYYDGFYQMDARGLDNSAGLSLGSIINYHTDSTSTIFWGDTDEENDDGQIVTMNQANIVYTGYFFRYVSTGTPITGSFINRLNSSTVGLALTSYSSDEVKPITITGLNLSLGSPATVNAGDNHLIRGLNATQSIHFYQVTAGIAQAEILS